MSDCIFCKIVGGEIPAEVVHRTDRFVAFRDISPKAPIHVLVIPVQHVASITESAALSAEARQEMPVFIAETATILGLDNSGYRVATNHGDDARQAVHHLHWHILGGDLLSESM